MTKMLALILAGGQGQRMGLLCNSRPKPVLPFACRFKVIDFTLSNCIHSGVSEIGMLVDHQRRHMSDYIGNWWRINARAANLHILQPKNGSYKGTADAIYQNIDFLQTYSPETTLVLAGDHVYRMDYREMLSFHERVGADVTIGVVSVPIRQAHRFGIVTVDSQERITDFIEKPQRAKSNLASMGIYIFNTQFLLEHLAEDHVDPYSTHDIGSIIIPRMVNRHKVFAYKFRGYWQDIGTIEAYYEANMELVRRLPTLSLNGSWPILTDDYNVIPPKLINCSNVKNSLIGDGCLIEGEVENSILFAGVTIGKWATVRNSIVMSNAMIGRYTTVDYSILDEDVNLGEFCYIGFGDSLTEKEKGITILGKGVKIPDYNAVHHKCRTSADIPAMGSLTNADIPS
jgi:glucose-1-phosphate adenylyltransferase